MENIIYIGMDVHKETFNLCALHGLTGEILEETKCASDVSLVMKFITKLKKRHGEDTAILTGYEAGCLGYSLYNQLKSNGIDCEILAPTTMYSSSKNKMIKNDRFDAKMIASNLANGTYRSVYVPQDEDVEVKEYIRMIKLSTKLGEDHMKEEQKESLQLMENQVNIVGFTPLQALTMVLSYYKGGYYEALNEKEFEAVVKTFVVKHM